MFEYKLLRASMAAISTVFTLLFLFRFYEWKIRRRIGRRRLPIAVTCRASCRSIWRSFL